MEIPAQENNVLNTALTAFATATGLTMRAAPPETNPPHRPQVDTILEIGEFPNANRFTAEIVRPDRIAVLDRIVEANKCAPHPLVLVCTHIGGRMQKVCRERKIGFLDHAGNAYLEAPGLFVYTTGRPKPAEVGVGATYRATRTAGLRIVFALLTQPDLRRTGTHRQIAQAAGVALGAVGPVLQDLEKRRMLRTKETGERRLADPDGMIDEWATHYPIRLRPKLNPRRFTADDTNWWKPENLHGHEAYWGGEPGGAALTHYLRPELATLYAPRFPAGLVMEHRLRADPRGRLEMLQIFWPAQPAKEGVPEGVAPPLLVYADLLATGDDRCIETAGMVRRDYLANLERG